MKIEVTKGEADFIRCFLQMPPCEVCELPRADPKNKKEYDEQWAECFTELARRDKGRKLAKKFPLWVYSKRRMRRVLRESVKK